MRSRVFKAQCREASNVICSPATLTPCITRHPTRIKTLTYRRIISKIFTSVNPLGRVASTLNRVHLARFQCTEQDVDSFQPMLRPTRRYHSPHSCRRTSELVNRVLRVGSTSSMSVAVSTVFLFVHSATAYIIVQAVINCVHNARHAPRGTVCLGV